MPRGSRYSHLVSSNHPSSPVTTEPKAPAETGLLGYLGILIGGGCLLVSLLGVVNTAFHLHLALRVSGAKTPLPSSWDSVLGLAAAGVLITSLSLFGSFVRRKFDEAKGKPLLRIGILSSALLLLVLAGRGLQVVVLTLTYGSMLAYYSTDGDLDDVKGELAKKPDQAALDAAIWRAAQYNNVGSLKLLMDAGADLRQTTEPEDRRRCLIVGRNYEFTKVAIDHGVRPESCPKGETAIFEAVAFGKDDDEAAKIVDLLVSAGWTAEAKPSYEDRTTKQVARQKKWSKTLEALGRAPR